MAKIVTVTLAINQGAHAAQGVDKLTIHFDGFPLHSVMEEAVQSQDADGRFTEFLKGLEVDDIADFSEDFEEVGLLVLDVQDPGNADGALIGTVILEVNELLSSGTLSMS